MFDPVDTSVIIAGGSDFGVAGNEATMWITQNAGLSWTKAYEGVEQSEEVQEIAGHRGTPGAPLVAAFVDNGAFAGGTLRSIDGGTTWTPSSTGLPAQFQGAGVCVSPSNETEFVVSDAGPGWGALTGGVYRSTNGGQSWSWRSDPGASGPGVWDPVQSLYVADWFYSIVRRSEDVGLTFQLFDAGLESAEVVRSLGYALKETPRLLAASMHGVYATDLPSVVGVTPGLAPLRSSSIGTPYPSPFRAYTAIPIELASAGRVDLAVFDTGGRRVRTLTRGEMRAGRSVAMWDGRDEEGGMASAGIYLLNLRDATGTTVARKIARLP